jgi:hypothetical protein
LSNHSVVKSGLGFGYRLGHSTTDRAELIKDDLDPAGERQRQRLWDSRSSDLYSTEDDSSDPDPQARRRVRNT